MRAVRFSFLALLIGCIGWVELHTYTRNMASVPPDFEIVSAPPTHPREIAYGPAVLVLDTGCQILLPRTGSLANREITLQRGRVTATVRHLGTQEAFAVRTPQAVAGVRGTVFSVALDGAARTTVEVEQGKVVVEAGSATPVTLTPGQKLQVEGAEPPVVFQSSAAPTTPTIELPPVPEAFKPPTSEPAPPDHTTNSSSNEPARSTNTAARGMDQTALGQSNAHDRRGFGAQNASSANPASDNPEPISIQPRNLR